MPNPYEPPQFHSEPLGTALRPEEELVLGSSVVCLRLMGSLALATVRFLRAAVRLILAIAGRLSRLLTDRRTFEDGAVTLSGRLGDDARPYQKKQIRQAIDEVQR